MKTMKIILKNILVVKVNFVQILRLLILSSEHLNKVDLFALLSNRLREGGKKENRGVNYNK